MKKIIVILSVVVLCLSFAGAAFAVGPIHIGDATGAAYGSTTFGGGVFKPSTHVQVKVCSSTTAYVATSQHTASGSSNAGLQFATLSTSPAMPSIAADPTGPIDCADPTGGTPQPPSGYATNLF
jgi:hypothetical protein